MNTFRCCLNCQFRSKDAARRLILNCYVSRYCNRRTPFKCTIEKRFSSREIRATNDVDTSKSDLTVNTQIDTLRSPNILSRDSLHRLVELSRQEWKLIGMSAATLGITSSVTLLLPFASGQVIDYTITSASADGALSPVVLAGALFGLTSLAGGGVYLRSLWLARAGNRIVARLKQRLFGSLVQQETSFLEKQTTGDLLSRLSADAQLVQSAVTNQAVAGLRATVMSLGSASMLIYTSPTLALVSCLTLPPIFIAARRVGRKLQTQQEEVQNLQGEATSLAEQALSNINTVKQFVTERFEKVQFHNAIAKAHEKALDTAHMQAQLEAGVHVAANGAVLCVLGYGGTLVLQGAISPGDLAGFVMYSLLMAGNLSSLTSLYGDLNRALAASNRVFDILDRKPSIVSNKVSDEFLENELNPLDAIEFKANEGVASRFEQPTQPVSIKMQSVSFRYPGRADVEVLKEFSLTVSPGEVIGIVGFSGSGKSTIASLLTRLYDVENKDSILINDKPLYQYDVMELRRMIGVVQQEPSLFRGSIRDNIVYGEFDNVTEEQIMEAAQLAHVLEFADAFPKRLDTLVGSRGSALSGGQRQRVAIARVLLKHPPLVIFDEGACIPTIFKDKESVHKFSLIHILFLF